MFQLILPFQLELPFESGASTRASTASVLRLRERGARTRRAAREPVRSSLALDFAAGAHEGE